MSWFAPGNNYRSEAAVSLIRQPNVNGLLCFFFKSLLVLSLGFEMKSLRVPCPGERNRKREFPVSVECMALLDLRDAGTQVGNVTPERSIPATEVE